MPRYPDPAQTMAAMRGSVFTALSKKLATCRGELFPFHVGDTWMEPAEGCRMEDLTVAEYPGLHRYAPPEGRHDLLDAVVERTRQRTGVPAERDDVLVTAGATGALGAAIGALIEPGEEVLILSPYWPLIAGIVRSFRGRPVEVPFLGAVDSPETAIEAVRRRAGERTAALYLSTPNNPSGRIIPGPWLEAVVEWAASENLWILSDEVYEDYVYEGRHLYARSLDPERTFSVHSFSKAFGMAGNRCGYVVGPSRLIGEMRKVSTHTFYSTSTAAQIAARRALDGPGDRWVAAARELYREIGNEAAVRLGLPLPEGSTFLFLDVGPRLDERGLFGFLEDAADRGLFLAPGPSFGSYPTHVRLCYTAAEPGVTRRGIEVLAGMLAGSG